jgi:hypothetical protein
MVLKKMFLENSIYLGLYPFKRESEDPSRMFAERVGLKEQTSVFIMLVLD